MNKMYWSWFVGALTSLTIGGALAQDIDIHTGETVSVREFNQLKWKVAELEREMRGKDGKGGVKQQITILHSKKADRDELQATRDQAAHIFKMLKARQ